MSSDSKCSMSPSHSHTDTTTATTANSNNANDNFNKIDTFTVPDLHFTYSKTYISLYIAFLILCNVVIPCLLFYLLQNFTPITTKELIGISSAALGISSCFDAPFRLYRLVRYRKQYGPLGTDVWWHLDFVMWSYTFALLVFAFPLAIAPAIAFYNFFLMSTMMLVGPLTVVFFFTLLANQFGWNLPVRCSSEPSGSKIKPAVFYCIEDVAAVDFKHGRRFRQRVYDRYNTSPPFRWLMRDLTIYWVFCGIVYCGITATVTWASSLNFAFGWVLGQLFMWGFVAAFGCYFLARRGLRKERVYWQKRGQRMIKEKTGTGGIDEQRREAIEKRERRRSLRDHRVSSAGEGSSSQAQVPELERNVSAHGQV